MAGNLKDYATGIVVTAPSPATSGTSLTLQTGEGARMPAVPFAATAHPTTEMPTLDNAEKILVTDVTGDVLTITRAQGETTAKSIVAGWRVSNALFASDLEETDPVFTAWDKDYGDLTNTPTIPDQLSDLSDDTTHRLVTDTEKSTWNAKSDFSGSYDDLTNKPTLGSAAASDTTDFAAALGGDDNYVTDAEKAALHASGSDANMLVTAVPGSDHTASGIKIALTAVASVAFGDVCYIASTGKAALIDADAIATMSAIVMCADATISADASGNFLLMGIARDDTWNWTVGGTIYGTVTGTTGNTLSQTAPTGTDDVVQIMGIATHADRMFFNPQLVQIERS